MLMPTPHLKILYKDCKRKRGELRHMFKKSRTELAAERLTKYQTQTMRASSTSTTDTASEPCSSSSLIDEKKNEKKVHRYNVEVIASDNPKNGLNLNNGIIKHRDIAHLVCVAVNKANLVPSPHKYVYEGHSILYSSAELQMCDPISVSYSEVSESIQNAFGKKAKFHVIIKPCQTEEHIMNLNDLNQCETEDTLPVQEDRSLPTFFEFDIAQKTLQRL